MAKISHETKQKYAKENALAQKLRLMATCFLLRNELARILRYCCQHSQNCPNLLLRAQLRATGILRIPSRHPKANPSITTKPHPQQRPNVTWVTWKWLPSQRRPAKHKWLLKPTFHTHQNALSFSKMWRTLKRRIMATNFLFLKNLAASFRWRRTRAIAKNLILDGLIAAEFALKRKP